MNDALAGIAADVVECRACTRLVAWRERVARDKAPRFATEEYWGRPVPGFGDRRARILVVGLAPAAHGGNRTGRIFTGDRSGDFLFAALYRAGMASRPTSVSRGDGLQLRDAYVAAVVRCAPPANRPAPDERDRCLPYLEREIAALPRLRAVVALGAYAWDGVFRALAAAGHHTRPRPRFRHGAEVEIGPVVVLGCFHPSQQNTFTGKLTPGMVDDLMRRAVDAADASRPRSPTAGSVAGRGAGRAPG